MDGAVSSQPNGLELRAERRSVVSQLIEL